MRVFVTVGTGCFDELIRKVDRLAVEAVCQIGQGVYVPRNHQWFRIQKGLRRWYYWADVIVAHSGGGTLFEALPLGKRIIAVPNLHRTDAHQRELAEEFARKGLVLKSSVQELPRLLQTVQDIPRKRYSASRCMIPNVIHRFLEESA
jgi:UDP-N-acetylglucosamine transferase subunit ALG13